MAEGIHIYTSQKDENMVICDKINDLQDNLARLKMGKKRVGFVPTMGALHAGHASLIHKARSENDIVVVSIFVNPTQFTNQSDLKNYPRTPESDHQLLKNCNVDLLFSPAVSEIYPEGNAAKKFPDMGPISNVMEGVFRPGHFDGVVEIVWHLFEMVKPDFAYFGEKDFQQLAIIRKMVDVMHRSEKIVACKTVREANGLAMSSRNLRLTEKGREEASEIYRTLIYMKENRDRFSPGELKSEAIKRIQANPALKVEYVEIADEISLQPVTFWENNLHLRAFAAVYCEEIRLIDNLPLF